MSDEVTEKAGKMWLYVTGGLAALPLLYALSCGPVYVFVARGVIARDAFQTAYAPLAWCLEQSNTRRPAEGYILLWLKLTGSPVP